ncbi:MAG TPA: NAD(P)/FAD-dependent oxidoreductase [Elusimicrobiota bacterium]|nr:NAD(P)/FAD-dependent oxidoreductase [Elusimicrobiota bacterium]
MNWDHEALVIGGGPAGLGAAMALGRLRRSVLVCDDFRPRNRAAAHMHNFAGNEGQSPLEWRKKARQDVEQYDTVHFFEGAVASVVKFDAGFQATLSSKSSVTAKKVILAYGVEDRLPPIPGMKELWGKSVFNCPFCHGFEVRGKRIGVIGNGALAMRVLPMIFGVTSDITLFTQGKNMLTAEQTEILRRRKVRIVEHPVEKLIHDGDALRGAIAGGELIEQDAILSGGPPFHIKSDIGERLGCERNEKGLYKVDEGNRTNVPGVYAAGDSITMQQSVVGALSTGQWAGATASQDLLNEAFSD